MCKGLTTESWVLKYHTIVQNSQKYATKEQNAHRCILQFRDLFCDLYSITHTGFIANGERSKNNFGHIAPDWRKVGPTRAPTFLGSTDEACFFASL